MVERKDWSKEILRGWSWEARVRGRARVEIERRRRKFIV